MKYYIKCLCILVMAWALSGCTKAYLVNQTLIQDSPLLAQAFNTALTIEKDYSREAALEAIADLFLRENKFTSAREVVGVIGDPQVRAYAMARIAAHSAQTGDPQYAGLMMAQAKEALEKAKKASDRAYGLATLADTHIGLAAPEVAVEHLNQAYDLAQTIEDDHVRAYTFTKIADLMAKAGNMPASGKILSEAFAVARSIQDSGEKITALDMISEVLAEDGQFDEADRVYEVIKELRTKNAAPDRIAVIFAKLADYDNALKTARTIERPYTKTFTLTEVSARARMNDHGPKADEILKEAATVVAQVEDDFNQSTALERIAMEHLRANAYEHALALVDTIQVDHIKAAAMERVVIALGKSERHARAAKIAMQISDTHPKYKAEALVAVANQHIQTNNLTAAAAALEQALEVAGADKNKYHKAVVQASVVGGLAKAGQFPRAFEVAQAIEEDQQRSTALFRTVYWYLEAGALEDAVRVADEIEEPYLKTMALTRAAEKSRTKLVGLK